MSLDLEKSEARPSNRTLGRAVQTPNWWWYFGSPDCNSAYVIFKLSPPLEHHDYSARRAKCLSGEAKELLPFFYHVIYSEDQNYGCSNLGSARGSALRTWRLCRISCSNSKSVDPSV